MIDLRIEEFEITNYDAVLNLWKEAGLMIRPGDDLEGIKLKLQRDHGLFLVAREEDEIIGVVLGAWDGRRGWINHLAVKSDHRRRGIATMLIRELEQRFVSKGAKKVNAQAYRWNQSSLAFFKAAGYEVYSDLIMIGKSLEQEN